jgi:outer membrane biogenesis lipoprotein LolB
MRLLSLLAALLLLAACEDEPENIQAKAENQSRALEQRYREIEAEAENDVAAQVAPLDNEADALLNQLGGNMAATANAAD